MHQHLIYNSIATGSGYRVKGSPIHRYHFLPFPDILYYHIHSGFPLKQHMPVHCIHTPSTCTTMVSMRFPLPPPLSGVCSARMAVFNWWFCSQIAKWETHRPQNGRSCGRQSLSGSAPGGRWDTPGSRAPGWRRSARRSSCSSLICLIPASPAPSSPCERTEAPAAWLYPAAKQAVHWIFSGSFLPEFLCNSCSIPRQRSDPVKENKLKSTRPFDLI